jgi:hypothetical protein
MPDPSFFLPLILQSAVIPFGVAFAVLVGLRALRAGTIAPALAIAAGVLGAFFAILHGQWSPLPKVALDWLPWIAIVGTAGALGAERIGHAGLRLTARFALSAVVGTVVVWPALASLGMQKAMLVTVAAGVVLSVVWSIMARTADNRPTPPWLLAVVAGGAGMALMLDSSQSIGQLNGALASALAACVAFNLPRIRTAFSPAATGIAVLLLGALLANAYIYAGFPLGYIVLLAGGLIADPVVEGLNRLRKRSGGAGSWAAATVLTAIPVMVTIGLAVKAAADSGGY